MLFQDKDNKLLSLLRTPLGWILILCAFGCILLIVVSFTNLFLESKHEPEVPSEVDPASGEIIYLFPPTNDPPDGPIYIGFNTLFKNGMTDKQFRLFKNAVEGYAQARGLTLDRVSYLKNSYYLKASYVFRFSIVLNIDSEELAVEVDSSKGWKDILGATATIWRNGEEVYSLSVDENNVCDYRQGCYYEDDGT